MSKRSAVYRPPHALGRYEANRAYDKRRGSARDRGYDAAWDRASLAYRFANPLCVGCEARGLTVVATATDHIIPHQGDARLMWDQANWQGTCDWCHAVVKQRLERRYLSRSIRAADLRLDSKLAMALANELAGVGG